MTVRFALAKTYQGYIFMGGILDPPLQMVSSDSKQQIRN